MAIHPQRARSKSLPSDELNDDVDAEPSNVSSNLIDDDDVFPTRLRRSAPLVSLFRSSSAMRTNCTSEQISGELTTWLRHIEAMDLSFPVTADASSLARRNVDRCNADFLADTLGFVSVGSDINANEKIGRCRSPILGRQLLYRRSAAAAVTNEVAASALMPKLKPRRWLACDLPNGNLYQRNRSFFDGDDGPLSSRKYGVLEAENADSDDADYDDDGNYDDDEFCDSFSDVRRRQVWTRPGRQSPPVYNDLRDDIGGSTSRCVNLRSVNYQYRRQARMRTVATMPVILEDDASELDSGGDECTEEEPNSVSVSVSTTDSWVSPSPQSSTLTSSSKQLPSCSTVAESNGGSLSSQNATSDASSERGDVVVVPEMETRSPRDVSSAVERFGRDVSPIKPSFEVAATTAAEQSLLDMMHKKYCSSQYVQAASRRQPTAAAAIDSDGTLTGSDVTARTISRVAVHPPARRIGELELSRSQRHDLRPASSIRKERCNSPGDSLQNDGSSTGNVPNVTASDDFRSASKTAERTSRRSPSADDVLNVSRPCNVRMLGADDQISDVLESYAINVTCSSLSEADKFEPDVSDMVDQPSRGSCVDVELGDDDDESTWQQRFVSCADCEMVR